MITCAVLEISTEFGERNARIARLVPEVIVVPAGDPRYVERLLLILGTPSNAPIPTLADDDARVAQARDAVVNQEALPQAQDAMVRTYEVLATDPTTAPLITKYLPPIETANDEFARVYPQLLGTLENAAANAEGQLKFRYAQAIRGLKLLNGDKAIEQHLSSSTVHYTNYALRGMPNIRQLFVLACRIMTIDPLEYVKAWLGEKYGNPAKWTEFVSIFSGAECFAGLSTVDLGAALRIDAARGDRFVKKLATSITGDFKVEGVTSSAMRNILKIIMPMKIAYDAKNFEKLMPLTEALFMMMRGHNGIGHLEDETETNAPACAQGAYLGVLKALIERANPELGADLAGVTIADCAAG